MKTHAQVTAAVATESSDSAILEDKNVGALSSGLDVESHRSVESVKRKARAEDGVRHGDINRAQKIVLESAELFVVSHRHLDVEIAVRSAGRPRLTASGQVETDSRVNAGRDIESNGAAGAHPTVTLA